MDKVIGVKLINDNFIDKILNKIHYFSGGVDKESWCLNSDGTVRHDNVEIYQLKPAPQESPTTELLVSTGSPNHKDEDTDTNTNAVMPTEGDVIGLAYDHVELNFFLNGKNMEIPVRNVRGSVYPALYGRYGSTVINVNIVIVF